MTMAITMTPQPYMLQEHDIIHSENNDRYILRVRDLPSEDKPREKLTAFGPKNLSMAELVATLLGTGTRKEEVMKMAQRIVQEYGEKALIYETQPRRLAEALDIPFSKACQIVASFELGRRFFEKRSGRPLFIRTAKQAYYYFQSMSEGKKEQLRGLYLSSRYEVIHDEVISVGSLTANIVHPREVFQPAIERGAVAVIIAHNHPSGNVQPTTDDMAVTNQLVAAGRLLGIDLLDHLIITRGKFISIMEVKTNE